MKIGMTVSYLQGAYQGMVNLQFDETDFAGGGQHEQFPVDIPGGRFVLDVSANQFAARYLKITVDFIAEDSPRLLEPDAQFVAQTPANLQLNGGSPIPPVNYRINLCWNGVNGTG